MELFEDGFDVDVVSDGDVEGGDGGSGDAQVNAHRYFAVFLHQLAESTTGHFFGI